MTRARFPRALWFCRSGNAAVEMALVAPVLGLALIGSVDLGLAFGETIRLAAAARAGTQQGFIRLADIDELTTEFEASVVSDIIDATRDDAEDDVSELEVTASIACWCDADPSATVDCNDTCAGGVTPPMYTDVTVAADLDLLFGLPGVSDPLPLSETARLRVR
jgi:Flp pilus assembly protein TadG